MWLCQPAACSWESWDCQDRNSRLPAWIPQFAECAMEMFEDISYACYRGRAICGRLNNKAINQRGWRMQGDRRGRGSPLAAGVSAAASLAGTLLSTCVTVHVSGLTRAVVIVSLHYTRGDKHSIVLVLQCIRNINTMFLIQRVSIRKGR